MSNEGPDECMALNPSLSFYNYQRLPGRSEDEIRQLVLLPSNPGTPIHVRLIQVRLGDKPQFEALSYTWGDTTVKRGVYCDGKLLHVTVTLYEALQALRYSDRERVLWVDAVSINQEDLTEKYRQLRLMSSIYASGPVLVWLGQAHSDLSSALRAYSSGRKLDDSAQAALRRICRLPWWSRVWVQQEYYFGKSNNGVVFQLGSWVIQDQGVLQIVDNESHIATCVDYAGPGRCFWIKGIVESSRVLLSESTLDTILNLFQHKECTEERDRVFAILGILGLEDLLPALSYTMSLGEVYGTFTYALCRTMGHLAPLALSGTSKRGSLTNGDFPSWTVDWSKLGIFHTFPCQLEKNSVRPNASGDVGLTIARSADGHRLEVEGNSCGRIRALMQMLPSKPWTSWTKRNILGAWLVFVANHTQPVSLPHILDFARIFIVDQAPYNVPGRDALLQLLWDDSQCLQAMIDACAFEYSAALPEILQQVGFRKQPYTEQSDWQSQVLDQTYLRRPDPLPLDPPVAQFEQLEGPLQEYAVDKSFAPRIVRRDANDPRVAQNEILLRNIDRWADYRWFASVHGQIGLGPRNAEIDDEVVILYGGALPFVLHAHGNGGYALLGDCYIHELVKGEGLDEKARKMYTMV